MRIVFGRNFGLGGSRFIRFPIVGHDDVLEPEGRDLFLKGSLLILGQGRADASPGDVGADPGKRVGREIAVGKSERISQFEVRYGSKITARALGEAALLMPAAVYADRDRHCSGSDFAEVTGCSVLRGRRIENHLAAYCRNRAPAATGAFCGLGDEVQCPCTSPGGLRISKPWPRRSLVRFSTFETGSLSESAKLRGRVFHK